MRIAVVGAGAIGGWIAARLALAGGEVMALTSGGPLDGLRLASGDRSEAARFARFDGPADLVILAVKATALAAAVPPTRALLGPGSTLLPMLNGVPWWFTDAPLRSIDPDGATATGFATVPLLGSVVHASARREANGSVRLVHADRLILGAPAGGPPPEPFAALFEQAGIRVERATDIRRAIWYKLWGNATMNPLSALTGATADRILAAPELRPVILAAMAELAAVGAAIGCPIDESGEERMAVTARLGAFKTSMLQDVEAGRPIELEALLGAPREIAHRARIATPTLDQLYATTRLMAETRGLL
ncbi:2-dehydropantoate 2-reductase [Sphingomonas ginkgonis]|uniref:2-dehydropantoate 2-reductase n=1 Tax=Sphingomonas ginkgonis TaxID=2315330 RepID=A0A3R9WMN9_9SPHN|nr:2-dehydropantoate 2-reductase [Sphingomonas ginkgonis]RST30049.1 2-dehydropantoate 2-reductase [Sphingomonas ginkgonis]